MQGGVLYGGWEVGDGDAVIWYEGSRRWERSI